MEEKFVKNTNGERVLAGTKNMVPRLEYGESRGSSNAERETN